jgi:hypothetical protein
MVLQAAGGAAVQKFGVWFGSDGHNLLELDLLLGGAVATVMFPSAISLQMN